MLPEGGGCAGGGWGGTLTEARRQGRAAPVESGQQTPQSNKPRAAQVGGPGADALTPSAFRRLPAVCGERRSPTVARRRGRPRPPVIVRAAAGRGCGGWTRRAERVGVGGLKLRLDGRRAQECVTLLKRVWKAAAGVKRDATLSADAVQPHPPPPAQHSVA